MRNTIILLAVLFLPAQFPAETDNTDNPSEKERYAVVTCSYPELTIPQFFKSLIINHIRDFAIPDSGGYKSICLQFDLDPADSGNFSTYYTLDILHRLFTARTCTDGSRGDILNIPYLWHWTEPNPRHEIHFTGNGKRLTSVRHPEGFEKYATYADIDRTPYLFLTDLLSPDPKYYSSVCDTFSTFGWCSEREMAFISLTTLMGFSGNVIAPGCHSWSELDVDMALKSGGIRKLQVTIDNTFDVFAWGEPNPGDRSSNYNRNAHSSSILSRLKTFVVSSRASARMEDQVVKYLENKFNPGRKY